MNLYELLELEPSSNILEILSRFKDKCLSAPENTFYYTYALSILTNKTKKLFYDAALYRINITDLHKVLNLYEKINDLDEYEIIPFIDWLANFKDFFYDIKYRTSNQRFAELIESWYDTMENILEDIKECYIHSFYLE